MASDLDLGAWIKATAGLLAVICSQHPEGGRIADDARAGRTAIRLIFDDRQRHLVVVDAAHGMQIGSRVRVEDCG